MNLFQQKTLLSLLMPMFYTWLLVSNNVLAQSLTLSTERQTIEEGDIISLYVEADFQTLGNNLDYEALKQDFEVLSRQRSNFYNVINGQQQATTRWHLRLLPKKTGKILIPSLSLGQVSSQPYPLMVSKAKPTPAGQTSKYFLQVELNKKQVYLQQETLYTLRFYHQGKLISGNIRPPSFDNALVDNLKEESLYDKIIDGNYYTVYEWVYALYPQSSGTMQIQAPEFNGVVYLDSKQKAIRETAQTLSLEILPVPKTFPEPKNWLPAKSVFLKQEWKNLPQKIRVGDSLTRVITLQVFGQKANQLPSIITPPGKGYKIYKQQPLTQEEKLNDGIISEIEMVQTLVPTKEGKLKLPEQEIYWWNTQSNQLETLFLESRHFEVAAGMQAPSYPQAIPSSDAISQPSAQPKPASPWLSALQNPWIWISGIFAFAWLITLYLWQKQTKNRQKLNTNPQEQTSVQTFTKHTLDWCEQPAELFYQSLRNFVSKELETNLSDLALEPEQRDLVTKLEQHLYYQGDWHNEQQQTLCKGIQSIHLKPKKKTSHHNQTKLASLYHTN